MGDKQIVVRPEPEALVELTAGGSTVIRCMAEDEWRLRNCGVKTAGSKPMKYRIYPKNNNEHSKCIL